MLILLKFDEFDCEWVGRLGMSWFGRTWMFLQKINNKEKKKQKQKQKQKLHFNYLI